MTLAQAVVPALDPIGIPAPPFVFVFLLLLTMFLHVVFMNFVLGGSILAVGLNIAALGGRQNAGRMANVIYQLMPPSISMTITMGVAPLLFVQVLYGPFFYSANVLLGFAWFTFVVLVLAGFYLTYLLTYRGSNRMQGRVGKWDDRPGRRLAASLIATACFLGVAWTLGSNHELSLRPNLWASGGSWSSPRWHVASPTMIPRFLHDITGATAIAGLWIAGIGWWLRRRGAAEPELHAGLIRFGLRVATAVTMLQVILGFTLLLSLEDPLRKAMLGFATPLGSVWTIALVPAILLPMVLLYALQRPDQFRPYAAAAGLALAVVGGMLIGREQLRLSSLAAPDVNFSLSSWTVFPQYISLLVFLVLLVAGLTTVGIMLYWITDRRQIATGGPPAPPA